MGKLEFTNSAFVRSHGRQPSRTAAGSWAFAPASTQMAFGLSVDDAVFAPGMLTLAEAKRWLRGTGASGLWAVMP